MEQVLHDGIDFDQIMVEHPEGFEVILVKQGDEVHAYRNVCPHIGVSLDYGDGRCLEGDDTLICAMHGARFEAATGSCFQGPCEGQALQRIAVRVDGDRVLLV